MYSVIVQVGRSNVESAVGSSVILQCSYHIELIDTGEIDVEWSRDNADASDTVVSVLILYSLMSCCSIPSGQAVVMAETS